MFNFRAGADADAGAGFAGVVASATNVEGVSAEAATAAPADETNVLRVIASDNVKSSVRPVVPEHPVSVEAAHAPRRFAEVRPLAARPRPTNHGMPAGTIARSP